MLKPLGMLHKTLLATVLLGSLLAGCDRMSNAPGVGVASAASPQQPGPAPAAPQAADPGAPQQPYAQPSAQPQANAQPQARPPVAGDTESGPPAIKRMIQAKDWRSAGAFGRGDYLIALDYRPEGYGTYGFLYHGDGRIWFVENDEVVGGPFDENGPELKQVTAKWTEGERRRHQTAMRGIAALPKGCLTGCRFDVYQNGGYVGTRIKY